MKKKIYVLVSIIILILILAGIMLSIQMNNKNIQTNEQIGKVEETQEEKTDIQALGEWEDLSANWDTSRVSIYTDPTGRTAPVPIGFTASSVESEKYIDYNVEKKGTWEDLSFSSSGTYPWTQNASDGIWQSGNYNIANSTSELESDEITVGANGAYLSIECSVSSRANVNDEDPLSIIIENTETAVEETVYMLRGTNFGTNYDSLVYTIYGQELSPGKYKIKMTYVKDYNYNSGLDRGYVKRGKILKYDESGTDTATVHKAGGLVIYEDGDEVDHAVTETNAWEASKTRNQFVWVPVSRENLGNMYEENSSTKKIKAKLWDYAISAGEVKRSPITNENKDNKREAGVLNNQQYDTISYFNKYNMAGYTKDSFYKELELEYKKTKESIEKYGGFYIGRYETGNVTSAVPVVKRMNTTISNERWYNIYPRMRNISNNPNIQTSMIWGSLYDQTLQWLIESGEKTKVDIGGDSGNWGNYFKTGFQYYNSNGELSNTKTRYRDTIIPTGSAERNRANNIYDLAGNVFDWTLETKNAAVRLPRGGACSDLSEFMWPSSNRYSGYPGVQPDKSEKFYRLSCVFVCQVKLDKAPKVPTSFIA